jgi:hypothetical protein
MKYLIFLKLIRTIYNENLGFFLKIHLNKMNSTIQ